MATTGEILKVVMDYNMPGASADLLNIFYFLLGNDVDDDDLNSDVLDWATDEWAAKWREFHSNTASVNRIDNYIVDLAGLTVRVLGGSTVGVTGIVSAAATAAGVNASMYAPTARPKSRGRKYVPGVSQASVQGGLLDALYIAKFAELALIYATPYIGALGSELAPGVISTVAGIFLEFLIGVGFDDVPDYQRRRKPNVGS
uniref:Uncharacterized protein n=1 Tax=uncultured prokaryote TaxID=198431 RepID=A0A0H5Q5D0_9ZZZZ|nr:hypothetical protein [uncultured prokaryote]